MTPVITKAAVIGAGSMGSGIAAQFANGGIPVVLLDIPAKEGPRNAYAEGGLDRQLKANGFMHPDAARFVTTGNTEDDLSLLADADIIIEAIIEDLGAKQDLYKRLEAVRKPGSIVSSNTSTIRLAELIQGQGDRFAKDFVITHFFNPPRVMRLIEVLGGAETDKAVIAKAAEITDHLLGKTVIAAKDTPGFIANRIGVGIMAFATMAAFEQGLTQEEADAVWGTPFGIPRTGVFGLHDLIGIDVMVLIIGSLRNTLPASDRISRCDYSQSPVFQHLMQNKLFGVKSKAGFYKRIPGTKAREVMDFGSLTYRAEIPADLPGLQAAGKDLAALVASDDKAGRYAWRVLSQSVLYAAEVAAEIADDITAIDTAMELGYNWQAGPFALADKVGVAAIVERLTKEGETIPPLLEKAVAAGGFYRDKGRTILSFTGGSQPRPQAAGILSLAEVKGRTKPVLTNPSASLWDIGDDVALLEFTAKGNVIDPAALDLIDQAIDRVSQGFRGLVIGNEHPSVFAAGEDPRSLIEALKAGKSEALLETALRGQQILYRLKHAAFPVVGAPFGNAQGVATSLLLSCDALVAHAELNAGLNEAAFRLLPRWGGSTAMLLRWASLMGAGAEPLAVATKVFDMLIAATVSTSALYARDLGIVRSADSIVMNRARLLAEAKHKLIELASNYAVPKEVEIQIAGKPAHDRLVERYQEQQGTRSLALAMRLATILTGGDAAPGSMIGEAAMLKQENAAFRAFLSDPATAQDMEQQLAAAKPR